LSGGSFRNIINVIISRGIKTARWIILARKKSFADMRSMAPPTIIALRRVLLSGISEADLFGVFN
jgi:hypothetical protein